MVPETGLEPVRSCDPGGLSPLRLPIPPLGPELVIEVCVKVFG